MIVYLGSSNIGEYGFKLDLSTNAGNNGETIVDSKDKLGEITTHDLTYNGNYDFTVRCYVYRIEENEQKSYSTSIYINFKTATN